MGKYRFDFDAFLRTIILVGFTALIIWLIATQQLSLYINPKFEILVELAAAALILMCIVLVPTIISINSNEGKQTCIHTHTGRWAYLPFLVVLLLAVLIPNNTLNANLVDTKGLNVNLAAVGPSLSNPTKIPNFTANTKEPAGKALDNKSRNDSSTSGTGPTANSINTNKETIKPSENKTKDLASTENTSTIMSKQPNPSGNIASTNSQAAPKAGSSQVAWEELASDSPPKQTGLLSVTQNNFVDSVHAIYEHPSDYTDREISIIGFVYRNSNLSDDQFVLVRYLIVCCAADASPYGLLCELKDAKKYPQGTWLSIRGVIKTSKFNDADTPTIKITSVEKVEKPQNPYVFLSS